MYQEEANQLLHNRCILTFTVTNGNTKIAHRVKQVSGGVAEK